MKITVKEQKENATAVIQNALDEVFLSGGGTVEIEKGLYNIGAIRVRSHTTLYLKSGAYLKATRVPEDYDILEYDKIEPLCDEDTKKEEYYRPGKHQLAAGWITYPCSRWNHAIIRIFDAKNVSVIGEDGAVIDGSDCYDALGEEFYRGPHGISLIRSENVVCSGYTIKNTGNWAHISSNSRNLSFKNIKVLGGHDGVHLQGTDNVQIEKCEFFTGDDCVAGVDCNNVTVKNCVMNTACSAFRFGGTNTVVEGCKMYGPGIYSIRGMLSIEDKINGTTTPNTGRKNMLSVFTYYADFSFPIRNEPGNIVFKNCTCDTIDRFINYDYSGNNAYQCNRPLSSVSFDGLKLSGIKIPLFLHGDSDIPVRVQLSNSEIEFTEPVDALIYAKNCGVVTLKNVKISGAKNTVKSWGNVAEPVCESVSGMSGGMIYTDEPWKFRVI